MATELRADGIHFGGPVYNQNGNETNDNTYQGRAAAVVKVGFGSCSTVNQSASGGSGTEGYVDGSEINMGVPKASNNLYRVWYQSVSDDNDGSISGIGFQIWRYTSSSGWNKLLAQGSHSSYDNNMSDWYRTNNGIFWVQVHPSYPNEEHYFRLYWNKHNVGQVRFNSSIGGDQRRNGWQNNTFEVWEINRQIVTTTGNYNPNF